MSNSLKTRTFSDSLRTGLFNTIVGTRKLTNVTKKLASDACTQANNIRKDAQSTTKQAWNHKL